MYQSHWKSKLSVFILLWFYSHRKCIKSQYRSGQNCGGIWPSHLQDAKWIRHSVNGIIYVEYTGVVRSSRCKGVQGGETWELWPPPIRSENSLLSGKIYVIFWQTCYLPIKFNKGQAMYIEYCTVYWITKKYSWKAVLIHDTRIKNNRHSDPGTVIDTWDRKYSGVLVLILE